MTGRLVAEGFFAHLWVYLVCAGFVLLGLLVVSKAIDEQPDPLRRGRGPSLHWWHFLGSPLLSLYFCALGSLAIRPLVTHLYDYPWTGTGRTILIYVLFCTIGFVAPFTEFREIKLLEDGIANAQAPGWASINCTADETPESIDVRTDLYSYFVLADPHWRVASENYTIVHQREEGLSWVVAPILYDGPVDGCQTEYPLFAVCIDQVENLSPSQCGWDDERRGALTQIRLMTASPVDTPDRKEFWEEWVANPYNSSEKVKLHHENLFQFNTPSYDETVAYLEYKRNQYDTLKWTAAAVWFAASAPVAVLAFLIVVWVHVVENTTAAISCSSVSTCSDVPLSPTDRAGVGDAKPQDNPLPCGTKDKVLAFDNSTTS